MHMPIHMPVSRGTGNTSEFWHEKPAKLKARLRTLTVHTKDVFAVCATIQRDTEINRMRVGKYVDASLSQVPSLKPVSVRVFPGRISYEKLTKPQALIMKRIILISPLKDGDQRDMPKVRKWVEEISESL